MRYLIYCTDETVFFTNWLLFENDGLPADVKLVIDLASGKYWNALHYWADIGEDHL